MSEKKVQQYKKDLVAELKEQFSEVKDFFFTDYRGMTVDQMTALRRKLREANAEYHVVKNTYARIAFSQLEHDDVANLLVGPTAIAFSKDEAGPVAKAIVEMAKDDVPVEMKGGLVDGNIFDKAQVEAFSKLPTRIELIQKLMGTMNAPIQNAVFALNGVTTKLVRTLQAVADQKASE